MGVKSSSPHGRTSSEVDQWKRGLRAAMPGSLAEGMCRLIFPAGLHGFLERSEGLGPKILVAGHPTFVDVSNRNHVQRIDAAAAFAVITHQLGITKHTQVLH